jgi:hypothetical protein
MGWSQALPSLRNNTIFCLSATPPIPGATPSRLSMVVDATNLLSSREEFRGSTLAESVPLKIDWNDSKL